LQEEEKIRQDANKDLE
jgi:cell division septum initiation protein DivIVA